MKGVWEQINQINGQIDQIKKQHKIYYDWVDDLECEIYNCDDKGQPITNKREQLPISRVGKLEDNVEKLKGLVADHTDKLDKMYDEPETLKEQVDDQKDEIGMVRGWSKRNQTGIKLNKIDIIALQRDVSRMRESLGEGFVAGVVNEGGIAAGGGKRRKRTRGKKRTKKRRKSRKKTRRKKRKKKTKKRRRKKRTKSRR